MPPLHLHPTAPLAPRVLLPGDPGRALLLAQALLAEPKMFNHHRGLWGYTGTAADGDPLTIQSTGLGAPSAAIVVTELAELGARTLIRLGTCAALRDELTPGDLILVSEALASDGTSRALGAGDRVAAHPHLLERAAERELPHPARRGPVISVDLVYDIPEAAEAAWAASGALAVDLPSAALLTIASRRGLEAGSLLLVDRAGTDGARLDGERLREGEHALGELAVALLSPAGPAAQPVATQPVPAQPVAAQPLAAGLREPPDDRRAGAA